MLDNPGKRLLHSRGAKCLLDANDLGKSVTYYAADLACKLDRLRSWSNQGVERQENSGLDTQQLIAPPAMTGWDLVTRFSKLTINRS